MDSGNTYRGRGNRGGGYRGRGGRGRGQTYDSNGSGGRGYQNPVQSHEGQAISICKFHGRKMQCNFGDTCRYK